MFPCARSGDPFQKEKKHRRGKGDQAIQPQFICKPNGLWKKKPTSPDPLNKVKTNEELVLHQPRTAATGGDSRRHMHDIACGRRWLGDTNNRKTETSWVFVVAESVHELFPQDNPWVNIPRTHIDTRRPPFSERGRGRMSAMRSRECTCMRDPAIQQLYSQLPALPNHEGFLACFAWPTLYIKLGGYLSSFRMCIQSCQPRRMTLVTRSRYVTRRCRSIGKNPAAGSTSSEEGGKHTSIYPLSGPR
jgi:hypothetical protein